MKIYVASSWRNEQQPAVVERLRTEGHSVYDFRNPTEGDHGFSWRQISDDPPPWSAIKTREVLQHPIAEHGFKLDFDAMKWADACVMVQPCGRSAMLELGWMAGAGKLTFVLLTDGQEPELMLKVATQLCASLDEIVAALKTADGQKALSKTPRRWRLDGAYGCYFPGTDLNVGQMGGRGTGIPSDVEWIDAVDDLPWRKPTVTDHSVMVKVGGQSFRCEECKSNMFTRSGDRYMCNGCGAKYVGEP